MTEFTRQESGLYFHPSVSDRGGKKNAFLTHPNRGDLEGGNLVVGEGRSPSVIRGKTYSDPGSRRKGHGEKASGFPCSRKRKKKGTGGGAGGSGRKKKKAEVCFLGACTQKKVRRNRLRETMGPAVGRCGSLDLTSRRIRGKSEVQFRNKRGLCRLLVVRKGSVDPMDRGGPLLPCHGRGSMATLITEGSSTPGKKKKQGSGWARVGVLQAQNRRSCQDRERGRKSGRHLVDLRSSPFYPGEEAATDSRCPEGGRSAELLEKVLKTSRRRSVCGVPLHEREKRGKACPWRTDVKGGNTIASSIGKKTEQVNQHTLFSAPERGKKKGRPRRPWKRTVLSTRDGGYRSYNSLSLS